MSVRLNGSTSGYTELDAPAVAGNNTLKLPTGNGSAGQSMTTDGSGNLSFGSSIVSGTSQASTSGTSIDFTGIPSWVKRVTVMLDAVSTNGTSNTIIQIGDSGGIEATGYVAGTSQSNNTTGTSATTGFIVSSGQTAASSYHGLISIALFSSNQWIESGVLWNTAGVTHPSAGNKTLSGTLDRVRITTVNGTDTFDAGTINIMYE